MIVAAVGAPVVGGGGGVVLRCMLQHNDAGDGFFRSELDWPGSGPLDAGTLPPSPSPGRHCRDATPSGPRVALDTSQRRAQADVQRPVPETQTWKHPGWAGSTRTRTCAAFLLQRFFAPRRTMAWGWTAKNPPHRAPAGRVGVDPGPLPWMYGVPPAGKACIASSLLVATQNALKPSANCKCIVIHTCHACVQHREL